MEQVSPYLTLNEKLVRQIAAVERHLSQVQIALSTSPISGPHERLGSAFHCDVLFDLSSEFLWYSDVQPSTPSNVRILLETELSQIRDMTHTLAGGIDEVKDMVSQVWRLTRSLPKCRNVTVVAPISILPPELLARIFHFYALEAPPWSDGVQKLGWIAVTHVCQRWRQVALGDSSLWARITGFSPTAKWCKACVRAGLATGLFSSLPTPPTLPLTPPTPQGSAHTLLPSPFLHVTLFLVVKDT